jgi:hypothetical protein
VRTEGEEDKEGIRGGEAYRKREGDRERRRSE